MWATSTETLRARHQAVSARSMTPLRATSSWQAVKRAEVCLMAHHRQPPRHPMSSRQNARRRSSSGMQSERDQGSLAVRHEDPCPAVRHIYLCS
jgi:hypothetical protein